MKNEQSTVALSDEQREKLINLVDRLIRNPSAVTAKDCIIDGDTRSLQWIAEHMRALLTSPRSDEGASNLAEHAAKALEKRRRQAQFEWTDDQFEIWWNKDDRCNRSELIEDVRFILGFAERAAVSPATRMLNACDANALRTAIDAAEIAKFIDAERAVELRDIVMRSAVPPATADEQRAAFEAEVSEKSGLSCACDVRGRYIDPTVRGMWEARQADRASQVAAPFEIEPPEAGGYKGKLPALARTLHGQRIYSLGYSRGLKKGLADASQATAQADSREPVGDWLWRELMDYCRERGIAPANNDRLFKMVKRARKQFDSCAPADAGDAVAIGFRTRIPGFDWVPWLTDNQETIRKAIADALAIGSEASKLYSGPVQGAQAGKGGEA